MEKSSDKHLEINQTLQKKSNFRISHRVPIEHFNAIEWDPYVKSESLIFFESLIHSR